MLYHYLAADPEGKVSEADLEADDLGAVLRFLAGRDLRPISVQSTKSQVTSKRRIGGAIKIGDKVFLTKYLALMLRVGTDLLSAIDILIADFDKQSVKTFLLEVRDNLSRGQPFYQAFANHTKIFSAVFVNLVKAAEASGNLQQAFDDLSKSLVREAELQSNVRSSLIYPIILVILSLSIFIFLSTFALPKIAKVFTDASINPPAFSRVVFGVGLFFGEHVVVILTSMFGLMGFSIFFIWKTTTGRRMATNTFGRLPIVRKVRRELALQRFASTMSALMKAGLPINQTIEITADTVGSQDFRDALMRVSREGLSKGLTIGESFKRETVFPKVVTNLVSISEKAGHLEEVLSTLAEFYASGVEAKIRALVAFLEPMLLLVMGVVIAFIALSIIVPIYQLTTRF